MSTRLYTNFILTVIAAFLVLLTLNAYRINFASTAVAQDTEENDTGDINRLGARRFSSPGRAAPLDLSNVAQTQDMAVANATSDVAAANREIASALREVANAIKDAGAAVGEAKAAAVPAGTSTSTGGTVEVGPARAQ